LKAVEGEKLEDGGGEWGDGSLKMEVGSWKWEVGSWKLWARSSAVDNFDRDLQAIITD
jgi:hypothetical protein